LTASTAIDGWPIDLADTAGLRAAEEPIETEGVARAWAEIAAADAVLFVADTTADWDWEQFAEVANQAKRLLVVHNKSDLLPPDNRRPTGIAVSAKNGSGIEALCGAIAELVVPNPPPAGEAVPFTQEQIRLFREAAASLDRGDLSAARTMVIAVGRLRAD
jgi:tRNA modification GTPase